MEKPSGDNLLKAVLNESSEDVRHLLDRGVYVDYKDIFGRTPLYLAVEKNLYLIAKMLLKAGANVNTRPCSGTQSVLEVAIVHHENKKMVHLLLLCGADVEFCDINRNPPLFFAAYLKLYSIVIYLLLFQADVNVKNKFGKTLFEVAVITENYKLLSILFNWNAVITKSHISCLNYYQSDNTIAVNIKMHVIKIYVANLVPINSSYLNIEDINTITFKKFQIRCVMEVEKMKSHLIGHLTLYNILTNAHNNPTFATFERFNYVNSQYFRKEYPIYFGLIKTTFTNSCIRNCMLDSLSRLKISYCENGCNKIELPMEITRYILKELSNKEVKRIFTIVCPGRLNMDNVKVTDN